MFIGKAKVTSNSVDNSLCLVTIDTYGISNSTYPIPSLNAIPLVKDDVVWVMFDDEGMNPIILGKSFEVGNGDSVLFRSGDANGREIKATVSPEKFRLETEGASVEMKKDSIVLNDGNEAMVLGDTLKDLLSDTIDAIMKITVGTAVGTSSTPINVASFIQIKAKLDSILSTKSKLK